MSWFFQKINQQDFYVHYFRSIAEITQRNSQAIDYQTQVEFHFASTLPEWKPFTNCTSLFSTFLSEFLRELIFSSAYNTYQENLFPKIAFSLTKRIWTMLNSNQLAVNS